MFSISLIIGYVVVFLIIGVSYMVYHQRRMQMIQVEFLGSVLSGLCLVQIGSFVLSLPSTNISFIGSTSAINLGYTSN
jgi:hypothetical protein